MAAPEKVQVNVLLPEKLNHQLRVIAEVDGDKISAAVESAVRMYVEARKADDEWQAAHEEWARKQRKLLRAI